MKKIIAALCLMFAFGAPTFAESNIYTVESVVVSSSEKSLPFDFSAFFADKNLYIVFQDAKNYVDRHAKNPFFSFSFDDLYINYSNVDGLAFSMGYWTETQGRVMKKASEIEKRFREFSLSKEDIDLNLRLGQSIDINNYNIKKYSSQKVLFKKINQNYAVLLYAYKKVYVQLLLHKSKLPA